MPDHYVSHDAPIPLSVLDGKDPEHAESFLNENARAIEAINTAHEAPESIALVRENLESVAAPAAWAPLAEESDATEASSSESTFGRLSTKQLDVLMGGEGLDVLIAAAALAVDGLKNVAVMQLDLPQKAKAALMCLYAIGIALDEGGDDRSDEETEGA